MKPLEALLAALAHRQRAELPPDWAKPLADIGEAQDPADLARACAALGWKHRELKKRPGPEDFPLLAHEAQRGWVIGDQWHSSDTIRVLTPAGPDLWPVSDPALRFFSVSVPGKRDRMPSKSFAIFRNALLARRRMLVEATVATAIISVVGLAVSLFAMQVYDRVIPQAGYATLWVMLAGVVFAIGMEFVLRSIRAVILERESGLIDAEISEYFFSRMQSLRMDARPGSVGTLAAQMRGLEQIRSAMSAASIYFVADLPFALFMLWVVAQIGGDIVLVPLFALPVVFAFAWIMARAVRRETRNAQASSYRKNGLLVEAISANEVVKASRGHWDLLARWNRLVDQVRVDDERVRRWAALSQSAAHGMQQLVYVTMIAWGSLSVIAGEITMGALIACAIIAGRVNGPLLSQLPGIITQWSYARSALEGLDELLGLPVDREPDGEYLRPSNPAGRLLVDRVKFAYAASRSEVDIPRLAIEPGERVALLGPVGSGKSTLVKLLAGIYQPQSGTILLDGLDLQQVAEEALREHLAYLPQDYRLVQGTLRENLLLGLADPGDDALLACATRTGLAQVIASHPKGLDLPIGEGGVGLSGGQKQLVGLTRLLLGKRALWLLDEPTGALDRDTERRVIKAIAEALRPQDTLVLVTHKSAPLELVKRVVVIAQGRVAMDGPKDEIAERVRRSFAAANARPAAVGQAG